jgi:GGDEF domain-containing protein
VGDFEVANGAEHGTDENILIKNADIAMYYAKSVGRDNVKIFQEAMK